MRAALITSLFVVGLGCSSSEPEPRGPFPFAIDRKEAGDPITAEELAEVTDLYRELMERLRYFEGSKQRAFGLPCCDDDVAYGYGSWWSGIKIHREGRNLTFDHPPDGSDNNGLRTAPILEGACYAYALWQRPEHAELARLYIRGFSAYVMAMERRSAPDAPVLMTRAFYPEPIAYDAGGLHIRIDTEDNRPGLDNGATEYVHLTDNPHFGDIWVKNKRSKDDMGHMFRALGALEACRPLFDAALAEDDRQMLARYRAWARQVEDDGYRIATWNKALELWIPEESLAIFVELLDTECNAMYALSVFGRSDPRGRQCGTGVREGDELASALNPSNRNIFLSFHEAALHAALLTSRSDEARELARGLIERSDKTHAAIASGEPPGNHNAADFAANLIHGANAGVPLTWREVRTVHAAIREAHATVMSGANDRALSAFELDAPDGEYSYDLHVTGLAHRDLGLLLGSCGAHWRNPDSKPLLDCARLTGAGPLR